MIRRVTVASIVVLALLIVVARAIGTTNKSPALAMLDPGDCPQPCWHGIRPGVTTVKEARAILNSDPAFNEVVYREPYVGCWQVASRTTWKICLVARQQSDETIFAVRFWLPPNALQVGNIIILLGEPIATYYCADIRDTQYPDWGAQLGFNGNIGVFAYEPNNPGNRRLDPRMSVSMLAYFQTDKIYQPDYSSDMWAIWSGFSELKVGVSDC